MGNVCTNVVGMSRVGRLENTVGNLRNSGHGTLSATAMQLLKQLLVPSQNRKSEKSVQLRIFIQSKLSKSIGKNLISVPTREIKKVYFKENNFLETYTSQQTSQQISLTATSFPVGFITYFFIKSMIEGLKIAELNSNEMAM